MKKTILSALILFYFMTANAQFISQRNNSLLWQTQFYVTNSPGNTFGNSKTAFEFPDSAKLFLVHSPRFQWDSLPNQPLFYGGKLLVIDDTGRLHRTDEYFTKNQSDARYLQSITSGMIFSALGYTPYNGATNPSGFINSVPAQSWASITGKPTTLSGYGITDATSNARSSISLTTIGTSGAATYNSGTGVLNIPNYATSSGTVTSVGISSTDLSVSGSPVTTSGNITANLSTTGVSAGTYNGPYTVDSKGRITSASNETFSSTPNRSLSTTGSDNTFTISATRPARVRYTVNFAFALALLTSNGVVSLEYSTNGGSTWIKVGSVSNVYTVAVTLSGNTDQQLSGEIPAGALVRIYRSANTNVTVTLPTDRQQEVVD